jgi:hypothetical protein
MTHYDVLEHVFRYGHIAAVDTVTNNLLKGERIWRERLAEEGFYYPHPTILNLAYRRVYETLEAVDFDVDKAYISACKSNDTSTVQYLSNYVDKKLHKLCVKSAKSRGIISTQYVSENMDDVLIESLGEDRKLKYLLEYYSPKAILPMVLRTGSIRDQVTVLKHVTLEELRPYLDLINSMEAGKLVENMDYRFNIHRSIDLNLVRSTKRWVRNRPSESAVSDAIRYTLKSPESLGPDRIQVLKLIFSMANMKYLVDVMKRASLTGSVQICFVLGSMGIATNETIVQAIKDDRISLCQSLLKYTNQSQLNLAGRLGRVEIYNLLMSST